MQPNINVPYSKTTAFGGVETGRQKAIETDTAHGIMRYIGLIDNRSAISHKSAAKIVIVDELEVACVIKLMIKTLRNKIPTCGKPEVLLG